MSWSAHIEPLDRAVLDHLGGVPVTYLPASGPAMEVTGVFDEHYVLVEGGGESSVEQEGPAVWLRLEDLPANPEDEEPQRITVGGVDYTVRATKVDGLNASVLFMLHVADEGA